MVDKGGERKANVDPQKWLSQGPKAGALKKGMFVSITTWSGREIAGLVCDREQSGLLLDVSEPDVDSEGYVFLPWSSIEQVKIREVTQRRVKFLER